MLLAVPGASSTTSVPTWLAVLAIVAPVLTGWVGALLAWLAATRTAERKAALARQDEQRRWNRERREKAYLALLERRNELVEIRRAWAEGDDPNELGFDIEVAERVARQVCKAERVLREAFAEVELIGSSEAVKLARSWVNVLSSRRPRPSPGQRAAARDSQPPPQRPVSRRPLSPAPWDPLEEPKNFRDPFVDLIRRELGVED